MEYISIYCMESMQYITGTGYSKDLMWLIKSLRHKRCIEKCIMSRLFTIEGWLGVTFCEFSTREPLISGHTGRLATVHVNCGRRVGKHCFKQRHRKYKLFFYFPLSLQTFSKKNYRLHTSLMNGLSRNY